MEISLLSEKRGIYAIYQGIEKGYIIWSSFYGVVAISKEIIDKEVGNINEDNLMHHKTIVFDICEWSGYWSLKDVITRGIRKLENRFVYTKVDFKFNAIKESGMSEIANLEIVANKKY